jgi:hypothetical protein
MLLSRRSFLYIVVAASILLAPFRGVNAQLNESRQPVDMMILIDNSCSMFPQNQIVQGCDVWGNDPNFLRITGADLFLARLGFGEVNEDAYQLGVISFGDDPLLLSPLQPLSAIRDSLATKIANPKPQTATKIVPALQMAYDELANSPNRKLSNLPAIVLLTDGVPYPPQGQTEQDIEALVSKHSDTPLFIMLLEGQGKLSSDYERFIQFWETLATRTTNIFVYPIKDASQIEETYNSIIGQLQNTIPTKGIQISADKPLKIYVSSFLQKIVVTAVRTNRYDQGKLQITDSKGQPVETGQDGVGYFRGKENPIEVMSVVAPRLSDDVKNGYWTISSTTPVTVLVDREGSYGINFISPTSAPSGITNVYKTIDRQTPSGGITITFNLLDNKGNPIQDVQQISGQIITPAGQSVALSDVTPPEPGSDGVYTVNIDVTQLDPEISSKPGRFTFVIDAG